MVRFKYKLLSVDAKSYPCPYGERNMCKYVMDIFPVIARQLVEEVEFNEFKKASNVIRPYKLS